VAITRLCFKAGVDPAKCRVVDSQGILHRDRQDIYFRRAEFVDKWRLCQITNVEGRRGDIAEALVGADVCLAVSKPGPGTIKPEWISAMAHDAIVFACANPVPEIWPWEAAAAGARIVATGRSDFPNQVNNSLGFPGIFRGALDVRARTITDEMCIAAAEALAGAAPDGGMDPDCILPTMIEWEVYAKEAVAVGMKAQEQGIARLTFSAEELYSQAAHMIRRSRRLTEVMMESGLIQAPPAD
jgi:malate dehydrogenase (oxaloacetate-decarboxylating)